MSLIGKEWLLLCLSKMLRSHVSGTVWDSFSPRVRSPGHGPTQEGHYCCQAVPRLREWSTGGGGSCRQRVHRLCFQVDSPSHSCPELWPQRVHISGWNMNSFSWSQLAHSLWLGSNLTRPLTPVKAPALAGEERWQAINWKDTWALQWLYPCCIPRLPFCV